MKEQRMDKNVRYIYIIMLSDTTYDLGLSHFARSAILDIQYKKERKWKIK